MKKGKKRLMMVLNECDHESENENLFVDDGFVCSNKKDSEEDPSFDYFV